AANPQPGPVRERPARLGQRLGAEPIGYLEGGHELGGGVVALARGGKHVSEAPARQRLRVDLPVAERIDHLAPWSRVVLAEQAAALGPAPRQPGQTLGTKPVSAWDAVLCGVLGQVCIPKALADRLLLGATVVPVAG